MPDLRTLLDQAAGNPPDLPDLAAIRERGQSMKNRNRIRWAVGLAAASVLIATAVGVALQGSDRDTMPAQQQTQSDTRPPVTNACAVLSTAPRDTIAYSTTRPDSTQAVHLMSPDGSGDRCLVDTAGPDTWPRWSPDGRWIAFVGGDGTQEDLFVVRADGSELTRVTDDPEREEQPVWSPDGARLGHTARAEDGAPPSIHVVRRDGGRDEVIATASRDIGLADWSPDGNTLLYLRDDSSGGRIALWTMAPDGSEQRLLRSEQGDFGSGARYSPSGTQIAFQADLDGGCLYRSDSSARLLTKLTTDCDKGRSLSWSPDETRIVSAPGGGAPSGVEVVGILDGSQRVVTTSGAVTQVDWQPSTTP